MKLNARELRTVDEADIQEKLKTLKRQPIYFILENIYDTYNIGGIFRLADAIGVSKMYLCGQMEIPPNAKIKKASIGTYKIVPWEYYKSAVEVISELRGVFGGRTATVKEDPPAGGDGKTAEVNKNKQGIQIVAVEQDEKSIPYTEINYSFPFALVFGNETYGVTKETLRLVDQIAEIPMWGINKSLNVIVSAAIVSYWALHQSKSVATL